uniref:hypothetical protein n=1 Tax=Ruegeria arenilitoris TaxID=1173585 RepID=UPI00147F4CE5|nr:hypothetical protein [Ruegeria arenilitoris]
MVDVPFSAEPITIVRLSQPRCANVFGSLPCTASGASCFNTRPTCADPENYIAGGPLYLYFGAQGAGKPSDEILILPMLVSVSTTAARVNVAGADRRVNPLGIRASASITFRDAPHSDLLVDPYRATRSYDPEAQGTFWSKWLKRNRFGKVGMVVSIFEGFAGQALSEMIRRDYICDTLEFSGEESVSMKCRDVLSKATDEKAQAPLLSPGELQSDMDASQMVATVQYATLSDYDPSGWIRVGSEVMAYSSVAENGSGFLEFTLTERGAEGTKADEHKFEDRVQQCLRFDDLTVDQALEILYRDFTTIPAAYTPFADWAAEAALYLSAYRLTGIVTKPTAVVDLVGEILEQCQSIQWWDEAAREIKFLAVKPLTEQPRLLTEEDHILPGFAIRDFTDRRVSQVWFHFDQIDPTKGEKDEQNFRRVQDTRDPLMEAPEVFGDPAIRKVFARFIRSQAVAQEAAGRILSRYKEGAREISFAVSDKDGDIQVGEVIKVRHSRIQNATGAPEIRLWIITSRKPEHGRRRVLYTAEDATLAGELLAIADNGVGDYVGDGSDPFGVGWISDQNGLLPDGSPGMTIQ